MCAFLKVHKRILSRTLSRSESIKAFSVDGVLKYHIVYEVSECDRPF